MENYIPDDKTLMKAIRARKDEAFVYLHKQYYDAVKYFVTKNSGSEEDAEDVYGEGIAILMEMLDDGEYIIKNTLAGLFISVCKNKWVSVLRKRRSESFFMESRSWAVLLHNIDRDIKKDKEQDILWKGIAMLKKECQKIIKYFLDGKAMKEIATIMGYTAATVRTKKYECNKYLKKVVQDQPEYPGYWE